MKLTGRRRYRVQRRMFGKSVLVLQVEEVWEGWHNFAGHLDRSTGKQWRDARLEDLTTADATDAGA